MHFSTSYFLGLHVWILRSACFSLQSFNPSIHIYHSLNWPSRGPCFLRLLTAPLTKKTQKQILNLIIEYSLFYNGKTPDTLYKV